MNIRHLGLTAAALAALCPAVSNAAPAKASLDACVKAFEKTLASSDAAARTFKVVYRAEDLTSSMADYFPILYTFDLQAHNTRTGEVVARVRCSTGRRGIVALSPLDATQAPARVAKR